jgi:hypothetical protein
MATIHEMYPYERGEFYVKGKENSVSAMLNSVVAQRLAFNRTQEDCNAYEVEHRKLSQITSQGDRSLVDHPVNITLAEIVVGLALAVFCVIVVSFSGVMQ